MNRLRLLVNAACACLLFTLSACNSMPRGSGAPVAQPAEELRSRIRVSDDNRLLTVCSFNIKFLAHYTQKDHAALADMLGDGGYDLIVIQELIASPGPTGTRLRAKEFFDAMTARGYSYALSETATGATSAPLPTYSSSSEFFVTFFKPSKVKVATDIPNGFISAPLGAHPEFRRVPYATGFRTLDGRFDFVLVSVHLEPTNRSFRAGEFRAINRWLLSQANQPEKDLIVLGDCNVQSPSELGANTPANYISLNVACASTNIAKTGKPFDHVFYHPIHTKEMDQEFGFRVVDLVAEMRTRWRRPEPFPDPAQNTQPFEYFYSDHKPVVFRMKIPDYDDDN